jgi:hypothetical protein
MDATKSWSTALIPGFASSRAAEAIRELEATFAWAYWRASAKVAGLRSKVWTRTLSSLM